LLRVNPEQAPAFRPGSRRVDFGSEVQRSIEEKGWFLKFGKIHLIQTSKLMKGGDP